MFKLKSKLIVVVILIIGITAFISCEREKIEVVGLSLEEKIALNKEDALVHDFANLLARSMSDENGRSFIKEEALKEFDGDFDILFAEVKDKDLNETSLKSSNHKTFGGFLKSFSASDSKLKFDEDFSAFLNSLLEEYPLLQISMPEISEASTKNWDELNYIPLVAVMPDNFDENTTEVIAAYDMYGNVSYLDINNYPENPVIVIGQNERLVAVKKENDKSYKRIDECLEPYYETETYEYFIPVDCGGGGNTGGGNTGGGATTYDRDNNGNRDQLNKATFESVDAFRRVERWPSGRPEFKVIISYIEKIGDNYTAKTITKILTKNDWVTRYVFWTRLKMKNINLPIITWDKEIIGNNMKYTWIEQDNDDTKIEFSIGVSSSFGKDGNTTVNSSVTVTISAKDDEAGEDVVEYKDKTTGDGTKYETGTVWFWVDQR